MNPQEMFVTRLRRHRMRSRVSIEEIAANLRIRPDLLEALEKNDLTGLAPRPVLARLDTRLRAAPSISIPLIPWRSSVDSSRRVTAGRAARSRRLRPSWRRPRTIATSSVTSRDAGARTSRSRTSPSRHGMPFVTQPEPCALEPPDRRGLDVPGTTCTPHPSLSWREFSLSWREFPASR